jgi:hypothetical protein
MTLEPHGVELLHGDSLRGEEAAEVVRHAAELTDPKRVQLQWTSHATPRLPPRWLPLSLPSDDATVADAGLLARDERR